MRGYYQISGLAGKVLWAWLLMLPTLAITMWLEATKFNEVTAILLVIFFALVMVIFARQRVDLTEDSLRFHPAFGVHTEQMPLDQLQYVQFTKRTVLFVYRGENYAYWLSPSIHAQLQNDFENMKQKGTA
ncbi:hypothetical protein JOC36_000762 [Weissella uvarum]|uniref:EbsA family protein n=1 Tax=Weissella uvarum TaxID=1479233 RepID=UPI001961E1E3|nr:EbsA family protein [Weissella uvarum]MBM7617213.1 hypothetical protein [Weissella uvarum]MCM0595506.1 pore-forming protein [Weissella uvarum]